MNKNRYYFSCELPPSISSRRYVWNRIKDIICFYFKIPKISLNLSHIIVDFYYINNPLIFYVPLTKRNMDRLNKIIQLRLFFNKGRHMLAEETRAFKKL